MTAAKYWNGTAWTTISTVAGPPGPPGPPGAATVPDPLTLTNGLTLDTANLTFSGASNRILGDFSNATHSNRTMFQTSTANDNTNVGLVPNGTGTISNVIIYNKPDPNNASNGQFAITASDVTIRSQLLGTGSYLPLTFYTGGSERMRIGIDGIVQVANRLFVGATNYGTQVGDLSATRGDGTGALYLGGNNYLYYAGTNFSLSGPLTVSGTLSSSGRATGADLYSSGGYVYLGAGGTAGTPHIIGSGGAMYYRSDGVHNFQNTAGAGQIISASRVDTPQVYLPNGYSLLYVSGQPALYTNGWLGITDRLFFEGSNTGGQELRYHGGAYFQFTGILGAVGSANYGWGFQLPASHGTLNYTKAISTGWATHSRRELKESIQPLGNPLALVRNPDLHGVSYRHIHRSGDDPVLEPTIGFVAEDWYPHVPEVVGVNAEGEVISMDYGRVGAITFEAVKHLAQQVEELQARLAALERTP